MKWLARNWWKVLGIILLLVITFGIWGIYRLLKD